jgi:hypothetical protein
MLSVLSQIAPVPVFPGVQTAPAVRFYGIHDDVLVTTMLNQFPMLDTLHDA